MSLGIMFVKKKNASMKRKSNSKNTTTRILIIHLVLELGVTVKLLHEYINNVNDNAL